jgi:hypothetical protein
MYTSAEVDVDSGERQTRRGIELTRLDLSHHWQFSPGFALRAGVDRYERPDTEAERDAVAEIILPSDFFFEQGYWRYWVGGSHALSAHWSLDEQIGYTDTESGDDGVHWQVGLTRRGLGSRSAGSASLYLYNVEANETDGYGARLSGYYPSANHRFYWQPSVGYRWVEIELDNEFARTIDASLRANWVLTHAWSIGGGLAYALTEDNDRLLVDIGVTLRW